MARSLIRLLQLIGSLYVYALVVASVGGYVLLWPFDKELR